jgi:hypothetical protein
MATFVVGKGGYIRPIRNGRMRPFVEAAAQTFRIGDPLILETVADKGNQVKLAGTDPATGTVVGFAAGAASGVEGTLVNVHPLDEQAEFQVHVQNGGTLDNDHIGLEFGLVADATNQIYRLDTTETTSKVFRVVDFGPKPDGTGGKCAAGDVNGTYLAKSAVGGQAVLRT